MPIPHRFTDAPWQKFIGTLDLTPFVGGLGIAVDSWRRDRSFQESDPYWRFYLPIRGEFQLLYADETIRILPGYSYLVPPNKPFQFRSVAPSDHYFLHFLSDALLHLPGLHEPRALKTAEPRRIRRSLRELLREFKKGNDVASAVAARNRLLELVTPFIAGFGGENPPATGQDAFARLQDYLDRRLDDGELRIGELAAMTRLPRAAFSAEFHRRFGLPPKQYLTSRRLARAKHLLLQSELGNKEIALQCGFPNELFFYRIFRKHTGVTPGEYRRNNRFD